MAYAAAVRVGVFRGVRRIELEQAPEPVAGPGDVVIDVKACGICGSDLHTYLEGALVEVGQVLGHEFSGDVVEVGAEVTGLAPGDRVTAIPIQPCGSCRRCTEGNGHLCEHMHERGIGFGIPGAFADKLWIPEVRLGVNVHALPDELDYEAGANVEPLAIAVHAANRSGAEAGQAALVYGLGTIGLHVAQVLRARGVAPVLGVDLSPLRRRCAEELGVAAIDGAGDVEAAVAAALGDRELDFVFECAGAPPLIQRALELVRPRGTVVIVALYDAPATIDPMLLAHKEATVVGSVMIRPEEFREAIELLRSGAAVAAPLVTHRAPLADLPAAFELQCDKDATIKVMIAP
jgi:(R,R)-butanediol dehydrogenase / meso-butanediol dehydrogenase / diacetyl reductase